MPIEARYSEAALFESKASSSVSYIFYESVPLKIHAMYPKAIIIIILRNPAERAYSHYLMERRSGYLSEDFSVIVNSKSKIPQF